MNIKTKFDAGDSVWIIDEGDIVNTVVTGIEIIVDNTGQTSINYHFGKSKPLITKRENKVFKDKKDIIDYINKVR